MISQKKKNSLSLLAGETEKLNNLIKFYDGIEEFLIYPDAEVILSAADIKIENLGNLLDQAKEQSTIFLKSQLEKAIDEQEKRVASIMKNLQGS